MSYKFELICYYDETSKPKIQRFKQKNCDLLFYSEGLITGCFVIADRFGRIPVIAILYVNGKYFLSGGTGNIKEKVGQK